MFLQPTQFKGKMPLPVHGTRLALLFAVMATITRPESDDELDGKSSNSFPVGFDAYRFAFGFGMITAAGGGHIYSDIVTSPVRAEGFIDLLAGSVGDHMEKLRLLKKAQATSLLPERSLEH